MKIEERARKISRYSRIEFVEIALRDFAIALYKECAEIAKDVWFEKSCLSELHENYRGEGAEIVSERIQSRITELEKEG